MSTSWGEHEHHHEIKFELKDEKFQTANIKLNSDSIIHAHLEAAPWRRGVIKLKLKGVANDFAEGEFSPSSEAEVKLFILDR